MYLLILIYLELLIPIWNRGDCRKKKIFKNKLGDNYLDKLISGKNRRFDYLKRIQSNSLIYEKKIVNYYEFILKEQGYLK